MQELRGEKEVTIKEKIESLKDVLDTHYQTCSKEEPYFHGMANGIITAINILAGDDKDNSLKYDSEEEFKHACVHGRPRSAPDEGLVSMSEAYSTQGL